MTSPPDAVIHHLAVIMEYVVTQRVTQQATRKTNDKRISVSEAS